jgi:DNA-binding FadR family transcriptional regulator
LLTYSSDELAVPEEELRGLEITRTRLSDHVVLHIARQIVHGTIKPGDVLDAEPDLAAQFGVSKPIVRESLQTLASLGMVRVQQGKRTVVLEDADWDYLAPVVQEAFQHEGRGPELAQQLYEVRLILEAGSAEKAAERATPAQVEELRSMIKMMKTFEQTAKESGGDLDTENLDGFLRLDRAFHEAVARSSGNLALRQVIRNVHQFLPVAWSSTGLPGLQPHEIPHLIELHSAVAEAITRGDAPGARHAMQTHLRESAAKQAARSKREAD